MTPRAQDYSQWYLDIIAAADMAEHASVKGAMVIKPTGYAIWEMMQHILDAKFKATGVENAYFPLFIPESLLKKEASHVAGFAPEVAVVTHAGGKKLAEPLVVRPTSETIIYDTYAKWVHSYRDLPILINQWANVVRWEMRPRLFLRTTEFLWQEGHTVHETEAEADARARQMLDVYTDFAENYLAMPVIAGTKSPSERFAGAQETYTIEAMMQDGKALQAGTSHLLGQNFAKAFGIQFTTRDGKKDFAWQTSWGVSTRMIGGLIMTHSDDAGLVLPPLIAPTQVVIIPIGKSAEELTMVMTAVKKLAAELTAAGVRLHIDTREHLRPGEKFFAWEKKGVPVRVEIGPKDVAKGSLVLARRDTSAKIVCGLGEAATKIEEMLKTIQKDLFIKAQQQRDNNTHEISEWEEAKKVFEKGGFVRAWWCGDAVCEAKIKEETKATIRCLPFERQGDGEGKCLHCGKVAKTKVIFAKAY
ncbi:MAG: proline--tRNA ligase [Candidatus Kerfeldbacteria bacterium RIFCSPHIGHO2_12_FULL_48_17]|uniref:Proline--tRNA ligase n=1 Tax=Candidatus Kerfeldbacteria bacterium RIFCSPHIGHO2_12_FULL_48_17 TaxID=1798542 RepID=A0A1G2B415_9BACT|nr:MAG: proline--tRNA ligase [Candidatus Kerfeldbacteria bacterium RIFCSPHIGHO2_12_FULL_48_17]